MAGQIVQIARFLLYRKARVGFSLFFYFLMGLTINISAQDEIRDEVSDDSTFFETSKISLGGGLALLYHLPEEKDFEKDGIPVDLFTDIDFEQLFNMNIDPKWLKIRVGINFANSTLDLDRGSENITVQTLYGAYRYQMEIEQYQEIEVFGLVGFTVFQSEALNTIETGFGYLVGGGGIYNFSELINIDLSVGTQFIFNSGQTSHDSFTIATGSNQIHILALYTF